MKFQWYAVQSFQLQEDGVCDVKMLQASCVFAPYLCLILTVSGLVFLVLRGVKKLSWYYANPDWPAERFL